MGENSSTIVVQYSIIVFAAPTRSKNAPPLLLNLFELPNCRSLLLGFGGGFFIEELFLKMMEVFSKMMKRAEGAGLLRGFRAAGRQGGGVGVSHLLFADDTILFCDANEEQILHVWMLLLCFQAVTGLKVNVLKSEMVPIGEVPNVFVLAEILGCRVGSLPMTYLGMPLGASHKSPTVWNPILEKFEHKLASWKKMY